ncbi:class 1 fructose-bisphosphatase [Couchioplanes azureus]|uniref:class 1 fructose-bisphosphatase n=1 Tax=Couchioplanes caeruleus TaxID=56438 RepID=UPI0016707356|nr:class 1 fructose-bisphosphatase [Couchioplanes caeruleus]GGQ75635.1 fructose-1,6-bisphosphatase class 1 [Couchioplanes caeruleus subsp. azureus]
MPEAHKTLTRYTIEQEHRHRDSTGDFSGLLNAISTAVKIIANQVNKGALVGAPKNLDGISNEVIVGETEWTGHLAAMSSDRTGDVYPVPQPYRRGKYLLLFDPLDGSGTVDVGIPVGTIFSILRSPHPHAPASAADFLQQGVAQVCAGFALYGPSTVLVLTTGDGVDGFTLDRDIGAFILTHPHMRIPESTEEFAINASNERFWEPPVKRYVAECLAGRSGARHRDFTMRWVACLVAETFRILTRGGVFLDPDDSGEGLPHRPRLLYAANPIAYVVEQAGGLASTGRQRLMTCVPGSLGDRVPLIFGSRREVERIERYHRDRVDLHDDDFSLFNTRSLFRS